MLFLKKKKTKVTQVMMKWKIMISKIKKLSLMSTKKPKRLIMKCKLKY